MDLFGEPELGIDYILKQYQNGQIHKLYAGICSYCKKSGFFRRLKRNKHDFCNRVCYGKYRSQVFRGPNSPRWKGNKLKIDVLRNSQDYKDWRTDVYVRDDYTCQDCGDRGGQLEAHHLVTAAEDLDLIFNVDNGRTLCIPCHKLIRNHEIEYREDLNGQQNKEVRTLCHGLCL